MRRQIRGIRRSRLNLGHRIDCRPSPRLSSALAEAVLTVNPRTIPWFAHASPTRGKTPAQAKKTVLRQKTDSTQTQTAVHDLSRPSREAYPLSGRFMRLKLSQSKYWCACYARLCNDAITKTAQTEPVRLRRFRLSTKWSPVIELNGRFAKPRPEGFVAD